MEETGKWGRSYGGSANITIRGRERGKCPQPSIERGEQCPLSGRRTMDRVNSLGLKGNEEKRVVGGVHMGF